VLWTTRPAEIRPRQVVLPGMSEDVLVLPNHHVFVFIGGQLPTAFLRQCGVEIDTNFGEP
jgi:thioredoxin reductase